jgi:hypothetical protein
VKALTIWQPWASLVVTGAKPYEFRGWKPPTSIIGQRIVIHASVRKIDWREVRQLVRLLHAGGRYAAQTCLKPFEALTLLAHDEPELPLGAGLGTAVVGEPRLGTDIAADFGVPRANDSDRDQHANWGWPMLEIERWADPVPMKGMQGLWTWPEPQDLGL